MRLDKIDALFDFIDFLYINKQSFEGYNDVIEEFDIVFISEPKNESSNPFERRRNEKQIREKKVKLWNIIDENIIQIVSKKARELHLMESDGSFNWIRIKSQIEDLPNHEEYESDFENYKNRYSDVYENQTYAKYLPFFFPNCFQCFDLMFDIKRISMMDVINSLSEIQDVFIMYGNDERKKNKVLEKRLYEKKNSILKNDINKLIEEERTAKKDVKKPKGYFNQLTHEQKQFLDDLIKDGFPDSHVYCELKTNQIITLTESQFVDYLNKFHERKYAQNHRFTSSKHLSIPKELSSKVEDFKSKITKK